MRQLHLRSLALAFALVPTITACSSSSKETFVVVRVEQGASAATNILAIELELELGARTATRRLEPRAGAASITLPVTADFQLLSGEGDLRVTAIALGASDIELDRGVASGVVMRDRVLTLPVVLGVSSGLDGGVDAAVGLDGAVDAAVDAGPVDITITPTAPNLGDIAVGQASAPQQFTVMNPGAVATGALTAMLSGTNASVFMLASDTCTGAPLAGGASCTVRVTATPTAAGPLAATLQVSGTPGGSAQASISANAVTPSLVFFPASKDFGALAEGMMSAEQSFMVQNQGAVATTALMTSLAGSQPTNFEILNDMCTGRVLNSGVSCTIGVRFKPLLAGARSASLTFKSASGTTLGVAALTGLSQGNLGRTCGAGTDCQMGNCVDSVCCNVAAAQCGGCKACNLASSLGTCSNVPANMDPHNLCTATTGGCSTDSCNGAGACQPVAAMTVCASTPGCNNSGMQFGQFTAAGMTVRMCDGSALTCPATTQTQLCPGLLTCNGASCRTSCANDLECIFGFYCDTGSGTCRVAQATGSCSSPRACRSNWCVAGICQNNCYGAGSECSNSNLCNYAGNGNNSCGTCSANIDCSSHGKGGTCDASATCVCANDSECTTATGEAPFCYTGSKRYCACYLDNGIPRGCLYGYTCVNRNATTGPAACKIRTGFLCNDSNHCASGTCTNGVCQ